MLMLMRANAQEELKHLRMIVVDEWHELLDRRGTQTQLAIARLARWRPDLHPICKSGACLRRSAISRSRTMRCCIR